MKSEPTSRPFHPGTPWELFRFEAPEAGAPAVDLSGGEPPAPAEPVEPAWAPPGQEWYEQTEETLQAIAAHLQQQQQPPQPPQQQPQPDPWDPFDDTFGERMARLEQQVQMFGQTHQQIQMDQGEELAYDILDNIVASKGDFLRSESKDMVLPLVRAFYGPEAARRYGYSNQSMETALEWAYDYVRELEDGAGKAYHERQMNQLQNLSLAPREPGAPAQAAQQTVYETGGDERDLLRKYGGSVLR